MKTLNLFKKRIGKKIYRNKTSCECETCKNVFENGIIVGDDFHAQYLYDVQFEYENINYRDKKDMAGSGNTKASKTF